MIKMKWDFKTTGHPGRSVDGVEQSWGFLTLWS